MKILTPTNLISVEVPKDAEDIRLNEFGTFIFYNHLGKRALPLNFFASEILGEVTDTEISFDAQYYVEEQEFDVEMHDGIFVTTLRFWDYIEESFDLYDYDESFRSLLQSNGLYFENPIDEPMMHKLLGESENYDSEEKEWQSYESKLIKGKLIILDVVC